MTEKTKAVNLTEDEISYVLSKYGIKLAQMDFSDYDIERINYLNRRLKAFNEPDAANEKPSIHADTDATNPANQQTKAAVSWPTTGA